MAACPARLSRLLFAVVFVACCVCSNNAQVPYHAHIQTHTCTRARTHAHTPTTTTHTRTHTRTRTPHTHTHTPQTTYRVGGLFPLTGSLATEAAEWQAAFTLVRSSSVLFLSSNVFFIVSWHGPLCSVRLSPCKQAYAPPSPPGITSGLGLRESHTRWSGESTRHSHRHKRPH
jgi:hypothetical protein